MALAFEDRRLIERFITDLVILNGNDEVHVVPELELARLVEALESTPSAKLAESLNLTITEQQPGREPRQLTLENFGAVNYAKIAYLVVSEALKDYKQPKLHHV